MPIRPILLKGHSRPLTHVQFNRESDLLFTCAKDKSATVWYSVTGERLGTYDGHEGAIYNCDVNFSTTRLLTGSADRSVRLWDVQSGTELFQWEHKSAIRTVKFALGEHMFLTVQDNTFRQLSTIFIYNLLPHEQSRDQPSEPTREMISSTSARNSFTDALWGSLNQVVFATQDDGSLCTFDVETGSEIRRIQDHKKAINNIQFSKDQTMLITASSDHTSKLYDSKTLTLIKTYNSDRPLNAAAISPNCNQIIVGGGQEAMNVTVTSAKAGHFETDFFDTIYCDYLGSVKGHFGPINTLAFMPNGKGFASGAEDGYVRLHHFDQEHFN